MGKQKKGAKTSNDADDLATLTDDNLSACLRNRYDTSRIYTLLGSSRLVAVNPYKHVPVNDDNVGLEYVAAYKDLQQQQPRPQPHLFDLVNRAYFYMRRTGTDQAMVIRWVAHGYFYIYHTSYPLSIYLFALLTTVNSFHL